ncbi:MAG: glycosyltransferase family 4 protein [Symploca sp. SIO2E9]|nr:glycosyltransferase family 4 protein [Symploca sp. SIO2E9]
MDNPRIAWLLPVAWFYWQPVLSEFTRPFPQTTVFTGLFPGFARGFENALTVKVVGQFKVIEINREETSYGSNFTYLSPSIVGQLLRFKPNLIFSSSFGIWTIFALLLKPLGKWRIVIAYEGSSPGVDYRNSFVRLFLRRAMVRAADAYITNSQGGKAYLTEILKAQESRVFVKPYEIPDSRSLLKHLKDEDSELTDFQLRRPIFLFVGHLIPRKGIHLLLEACVILQQQGYCHYSLLIVGDGPQREELEVFSQNHNLGDCVRWAGRVDYDCISAYFRRADVFVFPTLEDTWGVVALEAMLFGKPVLCSTGAGTAEMVVDGENGYVFAPDQPDKLAELMRRFIDQPKLIEVMGEKSKQIMSQNTPEAASKCLVEVTKLVLNK